MKTVYVLGFLICISEGYDVLLIRKKKPIEQLNKYNGIGGKLEPVDKSAIDAMVREFREETKFESDRYVWHEYGIQEWPEATCHCFYAITDHKENILQVPEDEEQCEWFSMEEIQGLESCQLLVPETYHFLMKAIYHYNESTS